MLFCEKCNLISNDIKCSSCGDKKLRPVTDLDFCYFVSLSAFDFEMFESALSSNNIEVVGVPYYPSGVTYAKAGSAEGRKVYIRYKDIEKSKQVYETIFVQI